MAEDLGDRTEDPTGRRISKARDKGQVAKSQDLSAAITLTAAAIAIAALGGWGVSETRVLIERLLSDQIGGDPLRIESIRPLAAWTAGKTAIIVLPIMLLMAAAGLAGQIGQVGLLLTAEPLRPKLSKLSPATGIKRVLGTKGAIKSGVDVAKLTLIGGVGVIYLTIRFKDVTALVALDLMPGVGLAVRYAAELIVWLLAAAITLGVVDYVFQKWQHKRDLRMTKQEVKEERRDVEGDPDVKKRRLRMAMEVSMQRAQAKVPEADVVIVNPTHFSVVLEYDRERMAAPRVTVKGVDFMAMRIRHIAMAHNVTIVERPPLARALYYNVREGQEVPAEYYEAVAEVLAYVYKLENRAAA